MVASGESQMRTCWFTPSSEAASSRPGSRRPVSRADRVPLPGQGTGTDSVEKRKNSWPPVTIAFAVII